MRTRLLGRVVVSAIVLIVLASVLASVNSSAHRQTDAGKPLQVLSADTTKIHGHLTVWSWNVAAKALKSIIPDFQKQYPNVDVDVVMSGTSMQTRFLLSLASGTGAPDIMQLQAYESPRYIATGRMTDLTTVANKYEKSFVAASWANCVDNGRVYSIPWDIGPCAVFYKPDVFERYGIDPEKIETWDDFIDAGKQILQKSDGRTKMWTIGSADLEQVYEIFLQQLHGQVFDDQGRIAINSAASQRALDMIRRLFDSGIVSKVAQFSPEWMSGLNDDAVACYPGAVWLGGTIKDTTGEFGAQRVHYRVFPLPAFDRGGLRTSNFGGSVLTIPNQCAQKEAAWAFIEYAMCTRQGQVAQYANFDLFPALLPALDDPFFSQPDPFYGGQKVREIFARAARGIPVLNRTTDWAETITYANQAFTAWAANHEPTQEMLDNLAHKLHSRLGRPVAPPSPDEASSAISNVFPNQTPSLGLLDLLAQNSEEADRVAKNIRVFVSTLRPGVRSEKPPLSDAIGVQP